MSCGGDMLGQAPPASTIMFALKTLNPTSVVWFGEACSEGQVSVPVMIYSFSAKTRFFRI